MSTTIDERVVSMEFDNKRFESNVKTSLGTLDKLKNSLNSLGLANGLDKLSKSAKEVDMTTLGNGVEAVKNKFSALEVMAVTSLMRITNSAIDTGTRLAKSLSIDQITAGYSKYEQKTASVQTLINSTGKDIDTVNGYLNTLMQYSDETSYSFTDMTTALANMSSSGGQVEKLIPMIMGIANATAFAGKGANEFSRVIYNLGQSYSQGFLSLMDWKSVQGASVNSKQLTEQLIKAGVELGKIKEGEVTVENFTDSLSKKWADTAVMEKAFGTFSSLTEAALKAVDEGKFNTVSDAIEALSKDYDELAVRAFTSAQEAKTFTEAIDATKDAVSSGWMKTFEIIFGNYDEAKVLWTDLANTLWDIFASGAEARNDMLEEWKKDKGQKAILEGISNIWKSMTDIFGAIHDAFRELFPPMTAEQLVKLSKGFRDFTKNLKLSKPQLEAIKNTFRGVFTVIRTGIDIALSIGKALWNIGTAVVGLGMNIFNVTGPLGNFVAGLGKAANAGNTFARVMEFISGSISNVINWFSKFLSGTLKSVPTIFNTIGTIVNSLASNIFGAITHIFDGLLDAFNSGNIKNILDVINGGLLAKLITTVNRFFKASTDKITGGKNIFDTLKEKLKGLTEIFDTVRDSLETWQKNLKVSIISKIAIAIAILTAAIVVLSGLDPKDIGASLGAITTLFMELMASLKIVSKMSGSFKDILASTTYMLGISTAILILSVALRTLSSLNMDQIQNALVGLTGVAIILVSLTKTLSKNKDISVKGMSSLISMSLALVIISKACQMLGGLSWDGIAKGLLGVIMIMESMGHFVDTVNNSKVTLRTGVVLIGMAAAILILGHACKTFAKVGWPDIIIGLGAIMVMMKTMSSSLKSIGDTKSTTSSVLTIIAFAAALKMMAQPFVAISKLKPKQLVGGLIGVFGLFTVLTELLKNLPTDVSIMKSYVTIKLIEQMMGSIGKLAKIFGTFKDLSIENVMIGFVALAGGMTVLVTAIKMLEKVKLKKLGALGAVMAAFKIFASAIKDLSSLSWDQLMVGLMGTTTAMIVLVEGLRAIDELHMDSYAVTAVVMASAIFIIAGAFKMLSSIGLEGAAIGIGSMVAVFGVLFGAVKMMSGLVTPLLKLSGSILAFSGSLVVLGASLAVVGFGILTIVTSLSSALLILCAIDLNDALKGLFILATAFITIGAAAEILSPLLPMIWSLSKAIFTVGISCIAVAGSIALLAAGLSALSLIGEDGARALGTLLTSILGSLLDAIPNLVNKLLEAFKGLVLGLVQTLDEMVPQLATSFLNMLVSILQALNEQGAQIIDFLMTFFIKIMDGVSARMPELSDSFARLVTSFFSGLYDAFSKIDTGVIAKSILTAGMLAGLLIALSYLAGLVPSAMIGVLGFGVLIAELSVVMAAVGAFAMLPGLNWLIQKGGTLLESLGNAIGKFVGGFMGGALESSSKSLPKIGKNLSNFIKELGPFLDGVSSINEGTASSMKSLGSTILSLTTSGALDKLVEWFSGSSSIDTLTKELPKLGKGLKLFSDEVNGVDQESVKEAAKAMKQLSKMVDSLPNEGGVVGFFTGDVDLTAFSDNLPKLGSALSDFSSNLDGIDSETIKVAAEAAKILAQMVAELPDSDGFVSFFSGDVDLDSFSDNLPKLGDAMAKFSNNLEGIEPENVKAATGAFTSLSKMAKNLPEGGGLFAKDFDVSGLEKNLPKMGEAITSFSESVGDLKPEQTTNAIKALKSLLELYKIKPDKKDGNLADLFSDKTGIGAVANKLPALGEQLSKFSESLNGINADNMTNAVKVIKGVLQLGKVVTDKDGKLNNEGLKSLVDGDGSLLTVSSKLEKLGENLNKFSSSLEGANAETMTAAVKIVKEFMKLSNTGGDKNGDLTSLVDGKGSLLSVAPKLPTLGDNIKKFSESVEGINPEGLSAAMTVIGSLVDIAGKITKKTDFSTFNKGKNGLASVAPNLENLGANIKKFSDAVAGIDGASVESAITAAKGIVDLVNKTKNIKTEGVQKFVDSVDTINKTDVKGFVDKFKGADSQTMEAGANLVNSLSKGMSSNNNTIDKAAKGLASTISSSFGGIKKDLYETGKELSSSLVEGLSASTDKSAISPVAKAANTTLRGEHDTFYQSGVYLVKGFANGIKASKNLAASSAKSVGEAASKALKKATDEHSPSKVAYKIGDFFGIGFANGISANVKNAYSVGTKIADSAKNGLQNSVRKLSAFITDEIETQPTIRPVLDLSDMDNGLSTMNDILGMNMSLGSVGSASSISSMMRNRQNDNNAEVVSAINSLRKDISGMSNNTTYINGVTYDDGSNITDAVQTLVRAAKVERRI